MQLAFIPHSGSFDDVNNNKPLLRLRALSLALAVSAVTVNSQAAEAGKTLQIQAQPLGSALNQLGQQTNLQLFFSPELVAGKQAPAVSGNLAPVQALQQLLQGSGLTFEMSQDTVVVKPLRRPSTWAAAAWSWRPPTSRWSVTGWAMPSKAWCRTTPVPAPWCAARQWLSRAR